MSTEEQRTNAAERQRRYRATHPYSGRTPEQRAKQAEYMRKWRAANPQREKDIQESFKKRNPSYWREWERAKRAANPEKAREEEAEYRNQNRQKVRDMNNGWRRRWAGMPEKDMHKRFAEENPAAVSIDHARPDFYMQGTGFIEIKRALTQKISWFRDPSVHFPGLFFFKGKWSSEGKEKQTRRSLDEQIKVFPRPLTVIVYHAFTGDEIARRSFQ